jgi:hypothetical protein
LLVFYINEANLNSCPHIDIVFGSETVDCILDTGSEVSLLSENLYDRLILAGMPAHEISVQNTVLVTAFGNRTKRVRKQVYLEFTIGDDVFEGVFLISPQLINSVLIGCDFATDYKVTIDFDNRCFAYERDGVRKSCKFSHSSTSNAGSSDVRTPQVCLLERLWTRGCVKDQPESAVRTVFQHGRNKVELPLVVDEKDSLMEVEGAPDLREVNDEEELGNMPLINKVAKCEMNDSGDRPTESVSRQDGEFVDEESESVEVRGCCNLRMQGSQLNPIQFHREGEDIPDTRATSATELTAVINKNEHLSASEREGLIELMLKYKDSLTSKPGKCKLLEYEFKLTDDRPVMYHSRTIPFALRPVIKKQIQQMIEDGVLEISDSPYINPVTVV